MNVLVTGAAGFIGSHLAECLCKRGHRVAGLDAFTPAYRVELKHRNAAVVRERGVDLVEADLACDDLSGTVPEADVIFHLAAQPGISRDTPFATYVRNNLEATHALLEEAARSPRLRCLVYVSTSSIYGDVATGSEETPPRPTSYYGVTKLAAEQLVLSYHRSRKLPACAVRLFSVFGPRERPEKLFPRLLDSLRNDTPFPLYEGSLEHTRGFTFVGDAVDGMARIFEHLPEITGEILNIGDDRERSTADGIRIVEALVGRRARIEQRPPRPGDQTRTRACIGKARRLLGFEPSTSLEEGLKAQVEWYQREHPAAPDRLSRDPATPRDENCSEMTGLS